MGEYYFSLNDIIDKAIGTDAYFQIKSILTSTKPADVAPVRHGLWIEHKHFNHEHYIDSTYECSECNIEEPLPSGFCPNCGVRMDLEEC